jgi:hypothetical protein
VAVAPVLLGTGESLFANLGLSADYECVDFAGPERAAHFRIRRRTD